MKSKSLWERCKISTEESEDGFVGIKILKDDIIVTFPLGYRLENSDDKVIRKKITSLLHILQKFNSKKENNKISNNEISFEFPILSYQYIILDYFNNGYYREKEISYNSAKKGKINWKQTIQKKKHYISNNSSFYLDFIVKENIINENSILTRIHEFCVYQSFIKLGWLYTDVLPMKPRVKFNKKQFIVILNDAISRTFNDSKKQLLNAMLNIIKNENEGNNITSESVFGTTSFEYVWEKMIDYIFGEENKDIYFPKARWTLVGKSLRNIESSSLHPDTILKLGNNICIIDAKYYKYGITGIPYHLPSSSSIQKQITYGEYLKSNKFKEVSKREQTFNVIHNVFIMPYDKAVWKSNNYKFIGFATADWKNNNHDYENVIGILVDTQHLMNNCFRKNNYEIQELLKIIEIFKVLKLSK